MITDSLSIFGLIVSFGLTVRAFAQLKGTTLRAAAAWAIAGIAIWLTVSLADATGWIAESGQADVFWYATSVLLLCPGIAVLGARKPGANTWGFFVLLPLVLVLMWPAVAALKVFRAGTPLELEGPAVLGYGVILVMAAGNYFGTRNTLPTLLYAAAAIMLVAPMSAIIPDMLPARETARQLAAAAITTALSIATAQAGRRPQSRSPLDSVWIDFVDTFGMAWSKRVMDHINDTARQADWPVTLEWHGLAWEQEADSIAMPQVRSQVCAQFEQSLRRLLKRFVDPDWIDLRLANSSEKTQPHPD